MNNQSVYVKQKSQSKYNEAADILENYLGISKNESKTISTKMLSVITVISCDRGIKGAAIRFSIMGRNCFSCHGFKYGF